MQSDEENFEESLETHSPVRRTVDPEDRFPLRNTPARRESEKLREAKMDQQNLFEGLTKSSAAATSDPNATGFAFGGMSSSSYETAEPTSNFEKLHAERKGG
jgi:hypothetical protein